MANNTLNTRIKLKVDTYENWTTNNTVLLNGEIGICIIPAESGAVTQEPSVLMKVGDGTKTFSQLSWVSGLAANVYNWALQSTKPVYTASEISGLDEYINGEIQDTNTKYKVELDPENDHKINFYSKELGATDFTLQDTITIPEQTYTLATGTANGTVAFNGSDVAVKGLGSAAYTDTTAYDKAGAATTALNTAKSYTDTAITGVNNTIGSVTEGKTVVELINDAQTAATYDDTALAGRVTANENAISTLNGSATTEGSVAKTVADAIAVVVANAPEDFDTLKEVADWIASDTTNAAALTARVTANENAITTLNGDTSTTGSVAKAVNDAKTTLQASINTKVDKVTGKGLSTNDYTTAEKTKLTGIESGAQVNVIESINVNGTALTVTSKGVNITVPTADDYAAKTHTHNTSDLTQETGDLLIFDCGSSTVNVG